ncbi:MAG: zinc ribbon domain-containing protein [Acidobacteria bacterium]|nr:zinc ribbon domain-containing protein [Acidobacteriota bacterium]
MLRVDVKKITALEMARCPNCSHAIDQMGKRTHCQKCNRQLTVLCISCQTNNSLLFSNCMKCDCDFRLIGVEYYSKEVAKLDFDLKEFYRLEELYKKATNLERIWRLTLPSALFLLATPCWFLSNNVWGLLLPFDLAFIGYLIIKIYGKKWATTKVKLPLEYAKHWKAISLEAKRQEVRKDEMEKQLDYYSRELSCFRQKSPDLNQT